MKQFEDWIKEYSAMREDCEKYYKGLQDLTCPALMLRVSFMSNGFNHLIYRKGRTERDRISQIMRFKLLSRAYDLIKITTTFQEYESTFKKFKIKRRKEKILITKQVQYWGLIAIINNRKIKVILRKIGNGNVHFWSVIPAWVTNKTRDGKYIRTMKGDPDSD